METSECSICLSEITKCTKHVCPFVCNHSFHATCINKWKGDCPNCRSGRKPFPLTTWNEFRFNGELFFVGQEITYSVCIPFRNIEGSGVITEIIINYLGFFLIVNSTYRKEGTHEYFTDSRESLRLGFPGIEVKPCT